MKFTKTWTIKNTGKLDWKEEFQVFLVLIGGNILPEKEEIIRVQETKAGEEVSVSVDLIAPISPGI